VHSLSLTSGGMAEGQSRLSDHLATATRELQRVLHIVKQHLSFYRSGDIWHDVKINDEVDQARGVLSNQAVSKGLKSRNGFRQRAWCKDSHRRFGR
jgi:hypothetical protein